MHSNQFSSQTTAFTWGLGAHQTGLECVETNDPKNLLDKSSPAPESSFSRRVSAAVLMIPMLVRRSLLKGNVGGNNRVIWGPRPTFNPCDNLIWDDRKKHFHCKLQPGIKPLTAIPHPSFVPIDRNLSFTLLTNFCSSKHSGVF